MSPSIHFFVHGQMLFLEIGRKEEGTHGRRIVPQSGGGNGFMMPLDPEIGWSERVCEE